MLCNYIMHSSLSYKYCIWMLIDSTILLVYVELSFKFTLVYEKKTCELCDQTQVVFFVVIHSILFPQEFLPS